MYLVTSRKSFSY